MIKKFLLFCIPFLFLPHSSVARLGINYELSQNQSIGFIFEPNSHYSSTYSVAFSFNELFDGKQNTFSIGGEHSSSIMFPTKTKFTPALALGLGYQFTREVDNSVVNDLHITFHNLVVKLYPKLQFEINDLLSIYGRFGIAYSTFLWRNKHYINSTSGLGLSLYVPKKKHNRM